MYNVFKLSESSKEVTMDRRTIDQAIRAARRGSFKIKIIFTDEAAAARVGKLLKIERRGIVEIDAPTAAQLKLVSEIQCWPDDRDREVIIRITDEFDDDLFLHEVGPGLHRIEAIA